MKIAILSANPNLYSTSRLVESAKKRGHEVEVINHKNIYISIAKNDPDLYVGDRELNDIDAIIPRIGASVTFYGSSIIRQFEMNRVFTTLSSLALVRSRDKLRSLQILTKADVGMPRTIFAKHADNVKRLIKHIGGTPVVIKLLESTQGKGVVLADSYNSASSIIDAFMGLDNNIIIQEFIKEANSEDIRAFVINGKVVASMKRIGKKGDFRSNLHQGGRAETVKLTRQEKTEAIKAAKALNLKIAGVDMLRSNRGPLILEVNSSPGLEGIEKATGKDVAGMIIKFVEDNKHKKQSLIKDKIGV
jgi:ribosomal protein S6--L-glutamate ligase